MNPEPRSIIICSHGTDKRFSRHNTNVVKCYQALEFSNNQKGFYNPGLDTYAPAGKTGSKTSTPTPQPKMPFKAPGKGSGNFGKLTPHDN